MALASIIHAHSTHSAASQKVTKAGTSGCPVPTGQPPPRTRSYVKPPPLLVPTSLALLSAWLTTVSDKPSPEERERERDGLSGDAGWTDISGMESLGASTKDIILLLDPPPSSYKAANEDTPPIVVFRGQ